MWGSWTQWLATHCIEVEEPKMCDRFFTFIIHLFLETVLREGVLTPAFCK